jgi:hypothetical protein
MQKKKRFDSVVILEIAVGLVLIAVLAVVVAGFFPISVPALSKSMETAVHKAGADSCSIDNAKVALWKGCSLHRIVITKRIDTQHVVTLFIPWCSMQGNLAKAAFAYFKTGAMPFSFPAQVSGSPDSRLGQVKTFIGRVIGFPALRSVTLSRASIEVKRADTTSILLKNLKGECRIGGGDVPSMMCSVSAGSLSVEGVQAAHSMHAEFTCDTTAIAMTESRGIVFGGKVRCGASADLGRRMLTGLTLSAKNCDVGEWYRWYDTANGYLRGRADLNFDLDSSDLTLDSLHGKGTLSAEHVRLSGFPFQKTLVTMFAFPHFARPRFDKVEADIALQPGGILSARARGKSDTLVVSTDGWLRIDGALDEDITCEFTREWTAKLTDFMRKTLEETKGGGRVLTCRIYGKIGNPTFEIESRKIIQKAVQNLFDDVRLNLQQWLR